MKRGSDLIGIFFIRRTGLSSKICLWPHALKTHSRSPPKNSWECLIFIYFKGKAALLVCDACAVGRLLGPERAGGLRPRGPRTHHRLHQGVRLRTQPERGPPRADYGGRYYVGDPDRDPDNFAVPHGSRSLGRIRMPHLTFMDTDPHTI